MKTAIHQDAEFELHVFWHSQPMMLLQQGITWSCRQTPWRTDCSQSVYFTNFTILYKFSKYDQKCSTKHRQITLAYIHNHANGHLEWTWVSWLPPCMFLHHLFL